MARRGWFGIEASLYVCGPADPAHHDHMIDVETGAVVEFRSDRIERLQAELAAELGYDIVHHRLELYVRRKAN